MAVKMNLRIITKRFAAAPEIEFLTKSISKANGYGTAMPPAWELTRFAGGWSLGRTFSLNLSDSDLRLCF